MHDPSLVNPMPGVLNHGPALNHNTSMLGSNPTAGMINPASSLHAGQPGLMNQQQAGVISPASLAGLAINHHGALPAGASYPGLPGGIPINQQQQVPLSHQVPQHPSGPSLNPTPVPSLSGSMAGSYHAAESAAVHLEESLKGSSIDLDISKQS